MQTKMAESEASSKNKVENQIINCQNMADGKENINQNGGGKLFELGEEASDLKIGETCMVRRTNNAWRKCVFPYFVFVVRSTRCVCIRLLRINCYVFLSIERDARRV